MSREDTQFKPGHPGGPGRPKGKDSARVRVLKLIDKILGKEENWKKLEKDLESRFNKNSVGFLMKIMLPLSPKVMEISTPDDKAPVRITLTTRPDRNGKGEGDDDN